MELYSSLLFHLLSLNTVSVRLIQVPCSSSLLFFTAVENPIIWKYHALFIQYFILIYPILSLFIQYFAVLEGNYFSVI